MIKLIRSKFVIVILSLAFGSMFYILVWLNILLIIGGKK